MSALVGRRAVVAIHCVNPGTRDEVDRFAVEGVIEQADERWIAIRREGIPALFGLPPRPEAFSSGDEDPVTASLTVECGDPEALLELRGLGYVPS